MKQYTFTVLSAGSAAAGSAAEREKEEKRIERKVRRLTEEGWTLKEIITPKDEPDKRIGMFYKEGEL